MIHRHRGRAMGTWLEVVVHADDARFVAGAVAHIHMLERRWSRFVADSELSRLNRASGRPVIVSEETHALVRAAVDAWEATDGRFDPTVHDALVAWGYDRTFDAIDRPSTGIPGPAPGPAGIHLDDALRTVTLPPGVRLDLGGIGKGTAADLVTGRLMDLGCRGAAVSIGGDLRVRGCSPTGGGWEVVGRHSGEHAGFPALIDGGVCTSSIVRRRWRTRRGTTATHLIDPSTGHPARGPVVTVTVLGGSAQQAEILAKTALLAGGGAEDVLRSFGVAGWIERAGPD